MKNKLFADFNFEVNNTLPTKLKKMLTQWVQIDSLKRIKLADKIPFDAKKSVVGYIQQFIYQDNKWTCVYALVKLNC